MEMSHPGIMGISFDYGVPLRSQAVALSKVGNKSADYTKRPYRPQLCLGMMNIQLIKKDEVYVIELIHVPAVRSAIPF